MRSALIPGGAVAAAFLFLGTAQPASAAEVSTGNGIIVVELSPDESRKIIEAADSAAAFSGMVAPFLPPEYQLALKAAAGGWATLRVVVPSTVPLRVVVTAIPPAIIILPQLGMTAADVIRIYSDVRAETSSRVALCWRYFAGMAAEKIEAARAQAAAYLSNCMLVTAVKARLPLDRLREWSSRLPHVSRPAPAPQSGTSGQLEANRDTPGDWERFAVVAHSDGSVSFLAHTGFLCAEAGGGAEVVCNRKSAKDWERWTIVKNDDGTIGLKSSGGHLLRAEIGGGFRVVADQPNADDRGTRFALEFQDGGVYLKSSAGKYLSAQP